MAVTCNRVPEIRAPLASSITSPLNYPFATSLKGTGEATVIGWISLTTLAQASTREWAFSFALDKDHWGYGYMTEAVTALVDHALRDLDAHRIYVEVEPDNVASTRVVEKCGFVLEGRLRQKQHIRGEWRDVLIYASLEH